MTRRTLLVLLVLAYPSLGGFRGVSYRVRRTSKPKGVRSAVVSGPIEFIVSGRDPFPARALDPVLHVGDYQVSDYRYLDHTNTTLVFTCAEPEKLLENAPVFLQYENDYRTRTDLAPFRKASVE